MAVVRFPLMHPACPRSICLLIFRALIRVNTETDHHGGLLEFSLGTRSTAKARRGAAPALCTRRASSPRQNRCIPEMPQPADVLPLELTSSVNRSTQQHHPRSHCEPVPVRLERQGTAASGGAALDLAAQATALRVRDACLLRVLAGFLFPLLVIGGWYFTFFPETPASRNAVAALRSGHNVGGQEQHHRLAEGHLLLLSVRVAPGPGREGHVTTSPPPRGFRHLHRFFDEMTRSRLAKVKLNHESPRRIIDPWIQRCRRALCYFCLLLFLFVLGMMGWSFAVGAGKTHY
ncbi:hypothetical protein B0H14DRAFT_2655937 [Mycena olivaceomarginata]|nr:hypothetical protein B0H14DRAFT_2655937 [Mycena olivaceomarginata]